jgi:hypothetical protein
MRSRGQGTRYTWPHSFKSIHLFIICIYLQVLLQLHAPTTLTTAYTPPPTIPVLPALQARPKPSPHSLVFSFACQTTPSLGLHLISSISAPPPTQLPCPFHHSLSWRAKTFATTRSQCPVLPQPQTSLPLSFQHQKHTPH